MSLAIKRGVDFGMAAVTLVLLAPLFALIAILIKADSRGPVFFRQERIGRHFRPFRICKFRTMRPSSGGPLLTAGDDPRITRIGSLLRRTKLDELPQLINILKGEMSFVGPRPEVDRYVRLFRREYHDILQVRPGMTDPASLKYRHEASLLARSSSPETEYVTRILPDKLSLAREYVRDISLTADARLIVQTMVALVMPPPADRAQV